MALGGKQPPKEWFSRIKQLEDYWHNNRNLINKRLARYGLSLPKDVICYCNTETAYSDPMTVALEDDFSITSLDFVHELMHVFLTHAYNTDDSFHSRWDNFFKSRSESSLCKVHIAVHYLHDNMGTHNPTELRKRSEHPEYVKSWQILDAGSHKLDELFGV
jgi:hypothetical protein